MQELEHGIKSVEASDNTMVDAFNRNDALIDQKIGELDDHVADDEIHITEAERVAWDAKETPAGAQAKANAAEAAANSYTDSAVGAIQLTAENVSFSDPNFTSTDVGGALVELFQYVSDGKTTLAGAIIDMGQSALGSMTFAQLAALIRSISNDANAVVGEVLAGRTFYQGGVKRTGTMPDRGSPTLTPGASAVPIPAGRYTGGQVAAVANLSTGNIRSGATVGGVAGSFSQTATGATAAQILAGRQAAVNGAMVTGTMPDRVGDTAALASAVSGNTLRIRPSEGYRDGTNDWVTITDNDWLPEHILEGKEIFGKTGTLVPDPGGLPTATPNPGDNGIAHAYYGYKIGDVDFIDGSLIQPSINQYSNAKFFRREDGFMWAAAFELVSSGTVTYHITILRGNDNGTLLSTNRLDMGGYSDYRHFQYHETGFLAICDNPDNGESLWYNWSGTLIGTRLGCKFTSSSRNTSDLNLSRNLFAKASVGFGFTIVDMTTGTAVYTSPSGTVNSAVICLLWFNPDVLFVGTETDVLLAVRQSDGSFLISEGIMNMTSGRGTERSMGTMARMLKNSGAIKT